MNPHSVRLALIIAAVGAVAYLGALVLFATCGGCAVSLPPEPPYVVTVSEAGHP